MEPVAEQTAHGAEASPTGLIEAIVLPSPSRDQELVLARPLTSEAGAINILGGTNNSGKSFILQRTWNLLAGADRGRRYPGSDIQLRMISDNAPLSVLYLGNSWAEKNRVGAVDVAHQARELPGDQPPYSVIRLALFHRHVMLHCETDEHVTQDRWMDDCNLRISLVNQLQSENELYICDARHPYVSGTNEALQGTLYFRRAKANQGLLEFVLCTHSGLMVPFPMWSDGQKALFYLFASIDRIKPTVLLIDEPENHLHPSFMSLALEQIRKSVRQTLVATHHPHLVFTEFADRVFYLEVETSSQPSSSTAPQVRTYTKVDRQSAPRRRVLTLETGFQKLASVYRLFDHQDTQLLHQSVQVREAVEVDFYAALIRALSDHIIGPSESDRPDRQTLQLASVVRELAQCDTQEGPIRILDIGAGLGRVAGELAKLSDWKLGGAVEWTCWEPKREHRKKLAALADQSRFDVRVPDSTSKISGGALQLRCWRMFYTNCPPMGSPRSCSSRLAPSKVRALVLLSLRSTRYLPPRSSPFLTRPAYCVESFARLALIL